MKNSVKQKLNATRFISFHLTQSPDAGNLHVDSEMCIAPSSTDLRANSEWIDARKVDAQQPTQIPHKVQTKLDVLTSYGRDRVKQDAVEKPKLQSPVASASSRT